MSPCARRVFYRYPCRGGRPFGGASIVGGRPKAAPTGVYDGAPVGADFPLTGGFGIRGGLISSFGKTPMTNGTERLHFLFAITE